MVHVPYETPFTPAVEIGWRLARSAWGRGYATVTNVDAMWDGPGGASLQVYKFPWK